MCNCLIFANFGFGVTQAETYREDFEKEREYRQELASRYEMEKAKVNFEHQNIVDDIKKQVKEDMARVNVEHREVVNELLKRAEEAEEKVKVMQEERTKRKGDIQHLEQEKSQLRENRDHLKQELEHLREELEHLREELGKKDENLQLLQVEKVSLEKACSKLKEAVSYTHLTLPTINSV